MECALAMVSFDEFLKVELRVGKVLECEPIEGSDKLFKLSVRLGSETRTIVSGIAKYYAPDELLGRKILVVANLEPRTIKGVVSHGMLLSAEDAEGNLSLATVFDNEFPDGSQVH